jgi:hypothetical protein
MKNIYLFLLLLPCFFLSGCSKDTLRRYEDRIIGTWELYDIDKRGSGNTSHQEFQPGLFTFREDGTAVYVLDGVTYNGVWDIDVSSRQTNCDGDGCDYETVYRLDIYVTDPASQFTRNELFDDMSFKSSNRFNAYDKGFVFQFRRQ